MTDYKQLCADLVDELNQLSAHIEATTPFETVLSGIRAYSRARAALAEPEPEGPTDKELHGLWLELYGFQENAPTSGDVEEIARAALARWGSPNSEEIRR